MSVGVDWSPEQVGTEYTVEDCICQVSYHMFHISRLAKINISQQRLSYLLQQQEQRDTMEKERDFILSKYENKKNLLTSLRTEIARNYETIQELEAKSSKQDERLVELDGDSSRSKKETESLTKDKTDTEKKVFMLRTSALEAEKKLLDRQRTARVEERALQELDQSIGKSKDQMEQYISEYEALYRHLQDMTGELERQVSLNKKSEAEMDTLRREIELKVDETNRSAKELRKVNQLRQLANENCLKIDEEKQQWERKTEEYNLKISTIRDVEIVGLKKDIESCDKQLSQLKQELEILRKKQTSTEKSSRTIMDLIQLNKNGKINLSIGGYCINI